MAIAVDATSTGAKGTGITTLSWTHVMGSVSNGMLIAGGETAAATSVVMTACTWDDGGANTAMSNTVNAVTVNQVETNGSAIAWLWHLKAAAAGSKTIKQTAASSCEMGGGSVSFSGVDQTTVFNAASPHKNAPAVGSNPSNTVTTTSGEMAVDCGCWNLGGTTTAVVGAGQTQVFNQNNGAGKSIGTGSYRAAVGATTTMTWTGTQGSDGTASVAISLLAAAGAAFIAARSARSRQPIFRSSSY